MEPSFNTPHPVCPNGFDYMVGLGIPTENNERILYQEVGRLYAELATRLKDFDPLILNGLSEVMESMKALKSYIDANNLDTRAVIQAGICQIRFTEGIPPVDRSAVYFSRKDYVYVAEPTVDPETRTKIL
ncbi:hypothetical protein TWF718_000457 [Orbilia javanica]|uniref:Uncharacterized protein n=1 Tax=Orbilia javanica TaxID=47235 RepID=A0AAN8RM67_9PEZI